LHGYREKGKVQIVVVAGSACMLPDRTRTTVATAINKGEKIEVEEEKPGSS